MTVEKAAAEKEFDKLQEREKTRMETYRKNQEQNLEKLHEKYQAATEEMQKRNT